MKYVTTFESFLNEATNPDYNQIIDWIKFEVDYVPDSEEEISKYPAPYANRAKKALEYRRKNFDTMSRDKKKTYE